MFDLTGKETFRKKGNSVMGVCNIKAMPLQKNRVFAFNLESFTIIFYYRFSSCQYNPKFPFPPFKFISKMHFLHHRVN